MKEYNSNIDSIYQNLLQKGIEDGIIISDEIYDTLGDYDISIANKFIEEAKSAGISIMDTSTEGTSAVEVDSEDINMLMRDIERYPLLTREEEISLAKKMEEGDENARELFINSNMRLVVYIALKYRNKGLDIEDLISEGSIGLILACDSYDYRLGTKFVSHAYWYIRRSIRLAIAQNGKSISLPMYLYDKLCTLKKEIYLFTRENNRQPTIKELSQITGEKTDIVKTLLEYNQEVVELDAELQSSKGGNSPSEHHTIKDTIEDEKQSMENQAFYRSIEEALVLLTPRERAIINMRFGLDGGSTMTLEEIGTRIGTTKERIRQIESCALRKLRHPMNLGR